ncbi:MAG: hypothetical protein K2W82_00870 [Candidatus Obscuribacterales bacterium]|nr:hypothetical protein [Candidatus Obscuribacterales bacterium]
MIKNRLKACMEKSCKSAVEKNALSLPEQLETLIVIEDSRRPELGDYACSAPLKLSTLTNLPPLELGKIIIAELQILLGDKVTYQLVSPGYINFNLLPHILSETLVEIHKQIRVHTNTTSIKTGAMPPAVQIIYSRCEAILDSVIQPRFNIITLEMESPLISFEQWQEWCYSYGENSEVFSKLFQDTNKKNHGLAKELILSLSDSQDGLLIAQSLQRYYQSIGMLDADLPTIKARLGLILAVKQTLEMSMFFHAG